MDVLVECVPNFSEGRDAKIVRALMACIESIPNVFLLDQEMDWDHHRSVLTFVGTPNAVEETAVALVGTARDLIDLTRHQGGHPRVGSADVVPFVPIRGITMDECAALAKRVGQRIASEFGIPVFLYQHAASRPGRINLEDIRRGGLEALAERMTTDPAWAPDFGPATLHPTAGATVVGARPALVAYNVDLKSADLVLAKSIAKSIRASGGGLPDVKAIGVELISRQIVQVSMNLTNVERTPIHVAYEAVKKEAARHGVEVKGSEIVGLVPQRAMTDVTEAYLQLERFADDQVLETRLEKILTEKSSTAKFSSLLPFLTALSAGTPTPGGGSVAALAGALAASLGVMACRVSAGTQQNEPTGSEPARSLAQAEAHLLDLRQHLTELIQADADAYDGVLKAYRISKDDASRPRVIAENLRMATEIPLKTAALAADVMNLLLESRGRVKQAVLSDLRVGLSMATAALEGGLQNAEENIKALKNQPIAQDFQRRVEYLRQRLVELQALVLNSPGS